MEVAPPSNPATTNAREFLLGAYAWQEAEEPVPIDGGMTNLNFLVRDRTGAYFVRVAQDLPLHQVVRSNEANAQRGAAAVGIAPELVAVCDGMTVSRFVEGRSLNEADILKPEIFLQVVETIKRCHRGVPRHLRGAITTVWPPYVVRDYAHHLVSSKSPYLDSLTLWLQANDRIEAGLGAIELVFGHNDLLSSNFILAPDRLWLVDWEYSGFTSPLLDLGGISVNNGFSVNDEERLLEIYFGHSASPGLWRQFLAMKAASALRESFWSMVMETESTILFDYKSYTAKNLARFDRAYAAFCAS
jgi:thiamine kinase-like enzyme